MAGYRNIDSIIGDERICVIVAGNSRPIEWGDIPHISDEVSLDIDEGHSMMVEVTWISEDKETVRGKVTRGYYPRGESAQIAVGTLVEFSREKIGRILKR